MRGVIKMKKALIVIFSIVFVLSMSSMASALSWTYTNDTNVYIDNEHTFPHSNGWVQLDLPGWYDASKVTLFKISMHGYGDNSASNIDVWLSHTTLTKTTSNSVKIDAFNAPLNIGFDKTWTLPTVPLGTVNYSYFSGAPQYFYIGYGCHFWHDWSKVEIEQTSVPEPTTMLLLGLGLMGVAGMRRKFKS
jgi:hypothetical protein